MSDDQGPEKALRQELMSFGRSLLEKAKKLDSEGQTPEDRDRILDNLKPQMDVFDKLSKWYGVATKGASDDGEGSAFHGFRKGNAGRSGTGANGRGDGESPPEGRKPRPNPPHRPKESRAPRDSGIDKSGIQ